MAFKASAFLQSLCAGALWSLACTGPFYCMTIRCPFSNKPVLLLFAIVPGCRVQGVDETLAPGNAPAPATYVRLKHTIQSPSVPECPRDMPCSPDILLLQPATSAPLPSGGHTLFRQNQAHSHQLLKAFLDSPFKGRYPKHPTLQASALSSQGVIRLGAFPALFCKVFRDMGHILFFWGLWLPSVHSNI